MAKTAVLECVKAGAKPGQIILAIDLTIAGRYFEVMAQLDERGYSPEIRHIDCSNGIRAHAILKDEQHQMEDDDEYSEDLLDEWYALIEMFGSEAVHLWRGHGQSSRAAA